MEKQKVDDTLKVLTESVRKDRVLYSFGLLMTDKQTIFLPPNPVGTCVAQIGSNANLVVEGDVISPDGDNQRQYVDIFTYAVGEKLKHESARYAGHFMRADGAFFVVYVDNNLRETPEKETENS